MKKLTDTGADPAEMKVLIDQLENLLLDLKEKGQGMPVIEKNVRAMMSFVRVLTVRYLRPGRDRVIGKPFFAIDTHRQRLDNLFLPADLRRPGRLAPAHPAELETLLDRTRIRAVPREEVPFSDALPYWSATTFE